MHTNSSASEPKVDPEPAFGQLFRASAVHYRLAGHTMEDEGINYAHIVSLGAHLVDR